MQSTSVRKTDSRAQAQLLFEESRRDGQLSRLWSRLRRNTQNLYNLACTLDRNRGRNSSPAGVQTVSLEKIQGSEGRSDDFDGTFHPLRSHLRERWIGVAAARLAGKPLPPVSLVQVGNVYFVRDGHHRISVARALGQHDIEAEVRAWRLPATNDDPAFC